MATRCTLWVIRMCYDGDLRPVLDFNVETGVPPVHDNLQLVAKFGQSLQI
ncbi:MAG TPA: hypothetical protein VFA74_13960 [Terriglobales bacterium]|nr:hypothetical protein [Terriglobales bacterium]